MTDVQTESRVKYGGGPLNLGDPDDKHLRKVEKDVLIPQRMRDKAKTEKCVAEVARFSECCKNASVLMAFECQKENAVLKDCLSQWYNDPDFKAQCTQEYLDERSEYRRTGIAKRSKNSRYQSSS
ncbi:COX assembly mitochondrial protein homolog [Bombus pyrosoma]|uniref:COX assembly mitochondrial protein homolog n=1 Tax=Bombus pyrosoma TaxID=396416 RepID=UPI001CB93A21|nr:COX assembly mitochondrial protein homolog [Bombus pyrosoma]XP_043577684.1 COX assembly mitochondrial protein homolog [Bombus pyrosoma]XP_043577685.1 COX assembly mitochondrial protein homolog [Bombus pyrosoma]